MNNIVSAAIIILLAITLVSTIYFTTLKYMHTEHVQAVLTLTGAPKCYGGKCTVFLDLKLKNYDQKMYVIRSLYFSILRTNNITQAYYGYNPRTHTCTSINGVEVLGEGCSGSTQCYLALCYGNVTLPDMSERTYSIRIEFNQTSFINSVAVIIDMYDGEGNEYRVSSNSVRTTQ